LASTHDLHSLMRKVRTAEAFVEKVANSKQVVLLESFASALDRTLCEDHELRRYGIGAVMSLFVANRLRI
jgi:hypothetical protein